MLSRLVIVAVAYFFSSVGILLMLQLTVEELRRPNGPSMAIFIWLAAWAFHLVMSAAWIRGVRLHRAWPTAGTLAGVASFLVWPAIAARNQIPFSAEIGHSAVGLLLATQFIVVAPCLLLAIWLVRFHWRIDASHTNA